MQSLELVRRILLILGLCLEDSSKPNQGRFTNCVIFGLLTGFLMITVDFILTNFDDRANALYAIMQFVTFSTVWTCYICFANQKHLTFEFLTNLQEIVDNYRKLQSLNAIFSMFTVKNLKIIEIYVFIKQVKDTENLDFMKKLRENHMELLNGHR